MTGGEALLAAATVTSAIGQLQAGANAQNAANFNAQVAFNNAHAARLAAAEDAKRAERAGRKRQGSRRASPGGSDKLDLLEDSIMEEKLFELGFIHKGEVQAVGFENNARLEIARGKSARSAATFGAFSSVLMGSAYAFGGGSSLFSSGGSAAATSSTVTRATNSAKFFGGQVGSPLQLTY